MRDLEYYTESKRMLMRCYTAGVTQGAKDFWAGRISWCDKKIAQSQARKRELARRLLLVVIIVNILVLGSILLTQGCNTVSGLGRDVTALSEGFREQMSK